MATYKDYLATPQQKDWYIREFLGIDAAKRDKVYRNAYRYLSLIAEGKRSGTEGQYAPIVADAKRLAEVENRLERQAPTVEKPSGRQPIRVYVPGIVTVRISNDISQRKNFGLDISDDPSDASYQMAAMGRYYDAFTEAFYEQTGLGIDIEATPDRFRAVY
ncbi:MAG: hypothetical protein ACTHMJ_13405 [Thermomicrobiales bacterium]